MNKPIFFVGRIKYSIYFLSIIFFLTAHQLIGQESTLNELRTPSAPGFVLLGVEPVSIERPTTPRGLATSLISGVTEEGLKPNFALEVSPYWLKSHPALSFDEYYHPKKVVQNFLQTFSVSLATAPTQNNATHGTDLAFGFRAQLFSGSPGQAFNDKLTRLNNNLALTVVFPIHLITFISIDIEEIPHTSAFNKDTVILYIENRFEDALNDSTREELLSLSDKRVKYLDGLKQIFLNDISAIDITEPGSAVVWINNLREKFADSEAAQQARLDYEDLYKEKEGFVMEVAYARVLSFPTNQIDFSRFEKSGVWLTFGYKLPRRNLDILALTRYLSNYAAEDSLKSLDYGASLVWHNAKMSFSFEALQRTYFSFVETETGEGVDKDLQHTSTARYNLNFQYKLNELVSITSSFGKNFDQHAGRSQNLISIFGITYNINNIQRLQLPASQSR